MLRRERREGWRSRPATVIAILLLGVLIGVWHNRATAQGRSDFLTTSVRAITLPLVQGLSHLGDWIGRQTGWIFRGRSVDQENRLLRAEIGHLREENARLREADIAEKRLRSQLGFSQTLPPQKVAADVLSLRPFRHAETLLIGCGSRNGVQLNQVAVSPHGVVGHLYDVDLTSSAVLLLTDSNSAIGAMVQRPESRATGVCKGNGGDLLSLVYLDREADVRVGDTIVSSGRGGAKGVYPKGLVIGTVASVENDASGSTRHVMVKPAVDFDRLEEVFVLR